MEKRQNKDFFAALVSLKLTRASELMEKNLEPAGRYNRLDKGEQALMPVFHKILQMQENFIGPLFSYSEEMSNSLLPRKWLSVVNYLIKKELIEGIFFESPYYDEPKMIRVTMKTGINNKTVDFSDGRRPRSEISIHGASLDLDEAIAKAIGEFLERFTLLVYREKDFLRASSDDLKRKNKFYLDPRDLAGFSEEQKKKFNRFQFDEKSDFLWTEGNLFFNNKTCLIPAQLIFWNYVANHQNWTEPILRELNVNGAAGHYSLNEAVLSGLYELVQRDGFLIYWLNKKAPPQIDLKTIDYEPLQKLLAEYRRWNLEVRFYDTTTDLGIPSCICTIFDHTGIGPKIIMAGGCEMDWDKALLRSLVEAGGVYHWRRVKMEREGNKKVEINLEKNYQPFEDFGIRQAERLSLWSSEEMFDQFRFFLEGKTKSLSELKKGLPKFSSTKEEVNYITNKFASLGKDYEIFYYEAKHQALKDLGYFSVQVIVPALVPLYLCEPFASLGAPRLKEAPEKLGFKPAEKWNPLPHPFP